MTLEDAINHCLAQVRDPSVELADHPRLDGKPIKWEDAVALNFPACCEIAASWKLSPGSLACLMEAVGQSRNPATIGHAKALLIAGTHHKNAGVQEACCDAFGSFDEEDDDILFAVRSGMERAADPALRDVYEDRLGMILEYRGK